MDEITSKVDPGAKKKSKLLERRHGGSKRTAEDQVAPNTHIDSSQSPWNSSSKASNASGLCRHQTHMHIPTNIYIHIN